MPNLTTLVLKDGQTTPADHSFSPRSIDAGIATLVESTGVPIGESRITFGHTRSASGRIRATLKFSRPIVQDVISNGVSKPTVVRVNYVDLTFNFDATSSTAERRDVVALIKNLVGDQTLVSKFLVDLESMY